jgi:hypothetical protein
MGATNTDDLFPDLHNPEGVRIINERCMLSRNHAVELRF